MIWRWDLPQSTLADRMQLKIQSFRRFRRWNFEEVWKFCDFLLIFRSERPDREKNEWFEAWTYPRSTPADAMELKLALVLEFRRVEISQKAPWPQPLLELHNGKGRRIFSPYILMILPLYVFNGRWTLSRVELGWFWVDLSWKIRENLAPGSFGLKILI